MHLAHTGNQEPRLSQRLAVMLHSYALATHRAHDVIRLEVLLSGPARHTIQLGVQGVRQVQQRVHLQQRQRAWSATWRVPTGSMYTRTESEACRSCQQAAAWQAGRQGLGYAYPLPSLHAS